ncbi:MAG TPA: acyclic terpene utilization AtuA family protein, partial [Reyranella sp.]|nr:acyclic terpene utilization AtuA family protein [Reyranella sp.]
MAKTVRVGCHSGFWGDTETAAIQLVRHGNVDYLVSDYLAEVTMSIMAAQKLRNPQAGYATDFVSVVMAPLAREIADRKIKVITNAGGVNPQACRDAVLKACEAAGVTLKVAVVLGDDLLPRADELRKLDIREMDTGAELPQKIASMNAYLGGFPIARALDEGADVVITGRCVDSAVTLGALIHAFGWSMDDHDALAAGTLCGHIIECGAQCNGGNFTDWRLVPDYDNMGFPVAEVFSDGSFVLGKPDGTGGLITTATVAEQMLYEIGDPRAYIVPDVVCDFTGAIYEQVGKDKVRVSGAKGRPPTDTYKVSTTWPDGYKLSTIFMLGGRDAVAKGQHSADAI